MEDPKRYVTPDCTMVYPSLFEPTSFGNEEPKYSATLLISKSNDLQPMREAVKAAAAAKFGTQIFDNLKSLNFPIRDGDEKAQGEQDNFYFNQNFIRVKSKFKPKLVNIYGEDITNENELYGGCIIKAYINFYGYEYMGKRGISAGLLAICKVEDGEPLGSGMVNAQEVFGSVIKQKPVVDFNSREYNETGQQMQEWGDNTPPPMGDDSIPF